jgi:hypothetical protein
MNSASAGAFFLFGCQSMRAVPFLLLLLLLSAFAPIGCTAKPVAEQPKTPGGDAPEQKQGPPPDPAKVKAQ